MREILFRGKRKDNGAWETGSLVIQRMGTSEEAFFIADKMTTYHTPVQAESIGQYTGLTDKNGNKIFEGDILKNTLSNSTCIVKWSKTHNAFTLEIQGDIYGFTSIGNKVYEVIGNIYDSPELRSKNGR